MFISSLWRHENNLWRFVGEDQIWKRFSVSDTKKLIECLYIHSKEILAKQSKTVVSITVIKELMQCPAEKEQETLPWLTDRA